MYIYLKKTTFQGEHQITICGSKSESNRLLILRQLFPSLSISNLSSSDDTHVLQKALNNHLDVVDIHHAGTAMRFLTAYYAFYTKKTMILTGSERMQNRPIKILVDALNSIGSKIKYVDKNGYPPLKIFPAKNQKNKVELKADVSSQYISALMLSAPKLAEGLDIKFTSKPTSMPYIQMTGQLMRNLGLNVNFNQKSIQVAPALSLDPQNIEVESDWSSASYYYSLVALSPHLKLRLSSYNKESLQGDARLSELYKPLGVKTTFLKNEILLENIKVVSTTDFEQDLNNTPDLAQTIAVTCLGLKLKCKLTGLHTLKIKETDRLAAMKIEIEKFGAKVEIDDDSLRLIPKSDLHSNQQIDTYNDHRMAMAFAPLSTKTDLTINNADVVSKSYPAFWSDFRNLSDVY
jgi:3-phosphoshikimate 1-carboxyvinyltransferase